jgi:hypothetical protein
MRAPSRRTPEFELERKKRQPIARTALEEEMNGISTTVHWPSGEQLWIVSASA